VGADLAPCPFAFVMIASIRSVLRRRWCPSTPSVWAICCSSDNTFPWRSERSTVGDSTSDSFLYLCFQLLPVSQELLQARVGEGVLHQLREHLERHRGHVRPGLGRLHHVHRIPQRSSEHERLVALGL